jgi:transcriptional regulator GlxA family with amidase domain
MSVQLPLTVREDAEMNIEIVLFNGFDELDGIAPFEVLAGAARDRDGDEVALVTLDGRATVRAAHGLELAPHRALSEHVDVLVVPGGGWGDHAPQGAWAEVQRGELPRAIAARHAAGATVASVCTGALLLAAAGLLEGRPATTHHTALDDLAQRGARVVRERVVDDGDVLTAGGVTSGLDLALHLVERLFGSALAAARAGEIEWEPRAAVRGASGGV